MSIELKLDKAEVEALHQVLDAYLSELSFEISNTDSFDYRAALHAQQDTLRRITGMLDAAVIDPHARAGTER